MEKIQDLLSQSKTALEQRTPSNQTRAKDTYSDRIDRAWPRLAKIFGYTFTRQYGERDDGTWAKACEDLTEQEVAQGLEACLRWDKEFPPNCGQFRALCRPIKEHRENAAAYIVPDPSTLIEKNLTDDEKTSARANLEAMKALLR